MGIATKIEALLHDDRRRARRADYGRVGMLRVGDAPPAEVIVEDLCRDGCRIQTTLLLSPNMPVSIGIGGIGLIEAEVRWHGSHGYGCTFVKPLPAGSITAAFSRTNVRRLTPPNPVEESTVPTAPAISKWPIAWRVVAVALFSLICWTLAGVAFYMIRG